MPASSAGNTSLNSRRSVPAPAVSTNPGPVRPEGVWSYEVGLKGIVPSRRLTFDLAAYRLDYSDLQALVDFAGTLITRNAGDASGKGVEGSLTIRPFSGVSISGGAAWPDIRYGRFVVSPAEDFTGNRLVRAPEFTANLVDTPVIDPLNAMRQCQIRLNPAHLRLAQQPDFRQQQRFLSAAIEFNRSLPTQAI